MPENDAPSTTVTEVSPDGRKIGVTFTRKVSDGNYGGTEVSAYVANNIPADADATVVARALGDILLPAVGAVLDQLHITYFFDAEAGVLREENAPVTVTTVATSLGATVVSGNAQATGDGVRVMNLSDQDGALPDWLFKDLKRDGVEAVFDNRKTRDPAKNQPWFKEGSKPGQGHGKDGQPKGYWPPKN